MPRPRRALPKDAADWPHPSNGAPVEVTVAAAFAANLRQVMNGRSGRDVGRTCNVDFTTVNAILNGSTWPDMVTIARLEAGLDANLWPRHSTPESGASVEVESG
jgi:transcriptional regulator with XRE-family HTH domain